MTGRTDAAQPARTRLESVSACVCHTHNTKILCKVADTLIAIYRSTVHPRSERSPGPALPPHRSVPCKSHTPSQKSKRAVLRATYGVARSWVCRDRRREARGDGGASAALRRLPQRPTLGRGWLELLEASCLTRQSLLTTRVEGRVDMLALGSCDAHTPVARIQRWWRYAARRAKESVPPRACHRERAT